MALVFRGKMPMLKKPFLMFLGDSNQRLYRVEVHDCLKLKVASALELQPLCPIKKENKGFWTEREEKKALERVLELEKLEEMKREIERLTKENTFLKEKDKSQDPVVSEPTQPDV